MERKELIQQYIDEYKTTYQSNYKFHSCFQKDENTYKFHYYMRDSQLQQINIFFEITITDKIAVDFGVKLHEYERISLIVGALRRLEGYIDEKTTLSCQQIPEFIKNSEYSLDLTNQDIINIYNYLKYHDNITQKTVDKFYDIYMPYLEKIIKNGDYHRALNSVNMLCDEILYEHLWTGINVSYMDQEYYFHLYYFRKICSLCIPLAAYFYVSAKEEISELVLKLFEYERFTFCMISVIDDMKCDENTQYAVFHTLKSNFTLVDEDPEHGNLAYSYLYALYTRNEKMFKHMVELVFETIIQDVLSIDNHDMQLALGTYILKTFGYEILIELFKRDHNSFVFSRFEIKDIPYRYYEEIRLELIDALKYYSVLMDNSVYRLGSLEQIININLLLMEYFKEETFNEK